MQALPAASRGLSLAPVHPLPPLPSPAVSAPGRPPWSSHDGSGSDGDAMDLDPVPVAATAGAPLLPSVRPVHVVPNLDEGRGAGEPSVAALVTDCVAMIVNDDTTTPLHANVLADDEGGDGSGMTAEALGVALPPGASMAAWHALSPVQRALLWQRHQAALFPGSPVAPVGRRPPTCRDHYAMCVAAMPPALMRAGEKRLMVSAVLFQAPPEHRDPATPLYLAVTYHNTTDEPAPPPLPPPLPSAPDPAPAAAPGSRKRKASRAAGAAETPVVAPAPPPVEPLIVLPAPVVQTRLGQDAQFTLEAALMARAALPRVLATLVAQAVPDTTPADALMAHSPEVQACQRTFARMVAGIAALYAAAAKRVHGSGQSPHEALVGLSKLDWPVKL